MANHDAESRLIELGLILPDPPKPVAAYIPSRLAGNMLFVSGQIPMRAGSLIHTGKVGDGVSLEAGIECARQCTLNGLAVMRAAIAVAGFEGGLHRIRQIVRVGCFVACPPAFTEHPKVANGASELLVEIFGDRGRHARAAVGAPSLPLDAPVEIEFTVEVG
jgi:enamine deaminase RidA (YjgF/YER057c/UK114 family)